MKSWYPAFFMPLKSSAILVAFILTLVVACFSIPSLLDSLTPAHGWVAVGGQYVGRDFLYFYVAAKQAFAGNIHSLYTATGLTDAVHQLAGLSDQPSEAAWAYPPHYLLLLLPFSALTYHSALYIWLAVSFLSFALVAWRCWHVHNVVLLLLLFNIHVVVCLMIGQNTLLLSALTGFAMSQLRKRPAWAGLCFAVISVKPHIALLISFVLLLGQHWRALASTIIATLVLMFFSVLVFGVGAWDDFIVHTHHASSVFFLSNNWFFSIYSGFRMALALGATNSLAWLVQVGVVLCALYALQKIWRGHYSPATQWLALAIATLLVTPYSMYYDAVWIIFPLMVWLVQQPSHADKISWMGYCFITIQIFAFVVMSVQPLLQVSIIVSALALLFWLKAFPNIKKGASSEAPYFSQPIN